jgi:hypothetical protein
VRWGGRASRRETALAAQCKRSTMKNVRSNTGLKGVIYEKRTGHYIARIRSGGKSYYLGSFKTAMEAASAYDKGARLLGKKARWWEREDSEQDLIGQRFGRLQVLERAAGTKASWVCRCDCGNIITLCSAELRKRASCGCYRDGHANHPLYDCWCQIKQRCFNPRVPAYVNYGARGITMHSSWRDSFEAFVRDLPPKPRPEYSIDRIDNDGNYEPGNVKWSTQKEQVNNQRIRKNSVTGVEGYSLQQISRRIGVGYAAVYDRIKKRGMSPLLALGEVAALAKKRGLST